jgi:UDP:flavonoid glycosyltransferase YjiC (YdhE family)
VPLVVIPQMGEQEVVGRRVEQLGAGIHLARANATAQALRDAVRRVSSDAAFRERAAALARSFKAAGGAGRGADAILAFMARRV